MSETVVLIAEEEIILLPEKGLFWEKEKLLVVSDLHLGKAGHFRKHGIPVSKKIHFTDFQILESMIQRVKPERVILLGDLFHSAENNEWDDFLRFLELYKFIDFILVEGNHDILTEYPPTLTRTLKLELHPFSFTHIKEPSDMYNISGHIHPGVSIRGKGRQSITMPCFYFAKDYGVLPAFGQFTGIKKIRPKKEDRVYGIAEGSVIELT
ncbi:putative phosphoesterase [Ekhidna lutea]|uniref:Putative phosphoesterase n=1 Tax=Ekhidna lutea TaxID=447679 RepID=A0A239L7X0_EKHLU|nr:ligase-associated DNA damage response endonuclease PdeM [Ekhidna lutea]SNT26380.1 putative phosphoesterase [Ekhidna lutea]